METLMQQAETKKRLEDLRSAFATIRNLRETFELPDFLNEKLCKDAYLNCYLLLRTAYEQEIISRHRQPMMNDVVEANLENVCRAWMKRDTFGLFMCGNFGNGKTTFVRAIQSALIYLNKKKAFEKPTFLTIVDSVQIAYTSFDGLDAYIKNDLLCIEDLGREPIETKSYGNVLNNIQYLLEKRYEDRKYTIITTNLTPENIREKYDGRIADRFNEQFAKVIFKNESFRGK